MGDSRSRYYDDCEDWECLQREADIWDVNWDVYSAEARHAEEGFRKKNLTGGELKLYVKQCLERDKLKIRQQEEAEEYRLYLKLKKKYDK